MPGEQVHDPVFLHARSPQSTAGNMILIASSAPGREIPADSSELAAIHPWPAISTPIHCNRVFHVRIPINPPCCRFLRRWLQRLPGNG